MLFGLYVRTRGGCRRRAPEPRGTRSPRLDRPSNTVKLQTPAAAAWVESEVERLVREHGLDLYRLDYNPSFKFASTPRDGVPENDAWRYYEAFYGMYDRIRRGTPG